MSVILATAGYDHKIRFWEAPSGICSRTLRFPDSQVNCLEITPDKQFLAAGGNPHVRLFEIAHTHHHQPGIPTAGQQGGGGGAGAGVGAGTPGGGVGGGGVGGGTAGGGGGINPVLSCEGHTSSVTSLGFQRDGRWMFSGSEDGTVKIFDLRSSTFQRSFDSRGPVTSVALHPNQTELVSGDQNGSVKIWDLRHSTKPVNDLVPDSCGAMSSSTSSSGSGGGGGGAPNHARVAIQAVDVSDRTIIAANNRGEVFVWDHSTEGGSTSNLKPVTRFRAHPPGSYCLAARISPDGRHLATTGSDGTARLWDTTSWELARTLSGHRKWVWNAVFSADSSYLVTASSDHSARLWNLRTGEVVRQYTGHQSAVTCVALNDSST